MRRAITRRKFLQDAACLAACGAVTCRLRAEGAGASGAGGASGSQASQAQAASAANSPASGGAGPRTFGRAKSVIQIWFWGGPAHTDTWDPKPSLGYDYCGPLTSYCKTNVDGLIIGQLMPNLAKCADKYAVVRGATHGLNAHETASYLVQTGREPGRFVFPCAGAVVSKFKGYDAGYKGDIPPYIVMTQPQGRFSESGFLGLRYKPFATGGDPAKTPFQVEGIVARDLTVARQKSRRRLLDDMDTFKKTLRNSGYLQTSERALEQAYNLVLGEAGKVFDVSSEPREVREAYGNNRFGNECLIARKLVEVGVPYVTINYGGWDTHKDHFKEMNKLLPPTDRAVAALIADLSARGLLDSTIVWWVGEFGRTPKIDWKPPYSGGRHHWGDAFSHMLAGGGFKGASVLGATDERGEQVVERPAYPCDIIGSIYYNLGIDTSTGLITPQGDRVSVLAGQNEGVKRAGILSEIMS